MADDLVMNHTSGYWYCVSRQGIVMLCANKADAQEQALAGDLLYQHDAPHKVMQLVDAAELERLRAALIEASEEIGDWGSYASNYFQKKHDLFGTVARFRALGLGQTPMAPAKQDGED